MSDFLENALAAANVSELPIAKKGSFLGKAVIKVKKVGGKEVFCLGAWNEDLKRPVIAMDFDKKPMESIVSIHPVGLKKEEETPAQMEARITAELEAKAELKSLGIDNPSGNLDELKAQIVAIKTSKDEMSLNEYKEFLLSVGYDEAYVGRLTLESGSKSVEKIKTLIAEVKEFGVEPKSDKNELEDQLKELKAIVKFKDELTKLGVENLDGTLAELKERLAEAKK